MVQWDDVAPPHLWCQPTLKSQLGLVSQKPSLPPHPVTRAVTPPQDQTGFSLWNENNGY